MKKNNVNFSRRKTVSRRDFLKRTSVGAMGFAMTGKLLSNVLSPLKTASGSVSKVVLVHHSKVIDETGLIQQPLVQKMIDKAVIAFSGENTLADAWNKYFSADDVVGLKVNSLGVMDLRGMDFLQHFHEVPIAIVNGLKQAGLKEKNFIIWDRSDEELAQAGFTINRDPSAMRIMGNKKSRQGREGQFNPKSYPVGESSSRVCSILADHCTSMINIPIPKTHSTSTFTCSLKNHFGTIDNPRSFHPDSCTNPGIPEVNAIPVIRDKEKLIVCDAMLVAIEGGPRWNRRFTKPYGGILVGTDPVAIDTIAAKILDDMRTKEGMDPIASSTNHISLSAELGLGTNNMDNIEMVKLNL